MPNNKRQSEDLLAPVGTVMPDGTVYLGYYADTIRGPKGNYITFPARDWFAMPQDAGVTMDFNAAADYAKNLDAHGHRDWQLPSGPKTHEKSGLLNEIYKNRNEGALKDSFNLAGKSMLHFDLYDLDDRDGRRLVPGVYWSSGAGSYFGGGLDGLGPTRRAQSLADGDIKAVYDTSTLLVRCVRSEERGPKG